MSHATDEARRESSVPSCRTPAWQVVLLSPWRGLERLLTAFLLLLLSFYRTFISPGLRPRCRFLPACSEYAELALHRHGLLKGLGKTLWRLARCQPLCKGGYDEP